nr:VCBS domain-containing protein [Accumulibacter sp.]
MDTRLADYQKLAQQAAPGAEVILVDAAQDGLAAVSERLAADAPVASIQILSHGGPGQFVLGSRTLTADSLAGAADTLRAWAPRLTADADILLYGCNVGAGDAGRALVDHVADLTGADVAASDDASGSATAGGDWTLEVAQGAIDSAFAAGAWDGLLANALPTVTLSATTMDVLLGSQFSFTASFSNAETTGQAGFAPFIDLILPATGKDGAGAEVDDGITFVSATYLGQTVTAYTLTFDAAGNATHPLATDATGAAVIVNAATYGARAGDQLVVLQLPYASVLAAQPQIDVVVTCQLSQLADTEGAPDLTVKARGGLEYGNDPAHNPTTDPSLFQVGTQDVIVHPTGLRLTQSINMPEGETVTGPNFERSVTITATPPPGQTLTNVDITQTVPSVLRFVSITPAAGGEVTSLTLAGGSTIVDPGLIQQTLALSPYLSAYTVRYASLSTAADTVLRFYVPEKDTTGASVLDPATGDDRTITFTAPTASGQWLPLDPRDQNVVSPGPPSVVAPATVTASGSDASFVAKSVALHKSVAIATNAGSAGLSPGDELQYSLNVDLSDYFMIGKTLLGSGELRIVDTLGDGQTFVNGSANGTLRYNGQQISVPLTPVTAPGASGTTTVTIDIAQALLNNQAIFGGALIGDLAVDGVRNGATHLVVSYRTTVAQAYATPHPQSEINEGDRIGNNATVDGTFLGSFLTLTGHSEDDGSTAALTVPTHTVATSIVTVNGVAPPANVELKPGDVVTFKLAYNLETGDYENFRLTAYLPLPLFDLGPTGSYAGSWTYGSGDTNADDVNSVTVGAGNSLVFDFGSYINSPDTNGKRIEVQFTLTVGNQPFADQRSLTVLGQSDQLTTIPTQQHLVSSGVVNIASVAEPVLAIQHGVVALGAGSAGVVSGTTGTWAAAGSTGAPFTGSITDLAAVDGSVAGIDGGDLVRLATAIENTGGLGAFDVATTVTLPAGFAFAGGSLAAANLAIHRGDGTALLPGTDYSVSGSTVTFLDAAGQPTLLPGRAGTAADASGANLVVITCDVVASGTIAASRNLQTNAALNHYSSGNGGPDFTPGADPRDTADQTVAAPVIAKVFANGTLTDGDSSAPHTTGANLVIGESMLYDIVVTLSEGTTQNLRVNDLVPAGMRLDTSFGSGGYQIITTAAASGAVAADFAGAVSVGSASAPGGDGADLGLTLSAAAAIADNSAGNNSFVVRVRLVAGNVMGNQAGVSRANGAQLIYSDPDGDTPNGSTPVDRTVALSGSPPSVRIVEPTLVISQSAATNGSRPPGQVDAGDTVAYTIVIRNRAAASDFNAFDLTFLDNLPTELDSLAIQSVVYGGGATNNGGVDFTLSGRTLATAAGANVDIPTGGSITITVAGVVNSTAANVANFTNTAQVRWTSLDGTSNTAQTDERTGADGLLNSSALNNYRVQSSLKLLVVTGATMSHVGGLADTPAPSPTDQPQSVAVGEIIRYRVGFVLAEGSTFSANIRVALPDGLSFINDGTAMIGLLSDNGIGNAPDLTTGADPDITGSVISLPDLLAADLSNTMTAVVNPTRIHATNPREIVFSLDHLNNIDLDLNREVIYLDFNVRVDNTAAVDTSKTLSASAKLFAGTTQVDKTQPISENIVEPNLRDLRKTVTDFDPNPAGTTGAATVTLSFSNSGDGIAYDSHLTDTMDGGSNYVLQSVVIDGTSHAPGSLPAGVTVGTAGGITADFASIAIGSTVRLIYTVDVPNSSPRPSTDATLAWSSLPETFTAHAGSSIGADASASGERDGSGGTTPPNTYIVREGAGLGEIVGVLWDDTASAGTSSVPDGPGIGGRTVTLTWAGVDGQLGNGDDRTFTATTDAAGGYGFGVLPAGQYVISAPATIANHDFGSGSDPLDDLAARIDTDGGTLASVSFPALGEAAIRVANVGYVRENDAPVNTVPAGPITLPEDNQPVSGLPPGPPLAIPGIAVSDLDADTGTMQMTLSVQHGTLNLGNTSGLASSSGLGTATMTITGSQGTLNTVLASLTYMPSANYNGNDTLTVRTSDLGQLGDVNGNGTPGENPADALLDTDTVAIVVTSVNDAPIGVNDVMVAIEKGGVNNTVGGLVGAAAVLRNDIDVDIATNGDSLSVSRIGFGAAAPGTPVGFGFTLQAGAYGELAINAGGNARYVLNDNHPDVQALRLSSNTLTEVFTYELRDQGGLTATATLTITIQGANDNPVGVDDVGTATEAGGVANSSGGSPATGNVLTDPSTGDTDVDANGESSAVDGIRVGQESAGGIFTAVPAGSGTTIAGTYGDLSIAADGAYTYALRQGDAAVQGLRAGEVVSEHFSYLVRDALGDHDIAQLTINVTGADDTPVAVNDLGQAQAGKVVAGVVTGTPVDAVGNALTNPPGADGDVDHNETRTVTAIRSKAENDATGTAGVVDAALVGRYGSLTIQADGSFRYVVDSLDPDVQALPNNGTFLTEYFTYTVTDQADPAALADQAEIEIHIFGVNDPPVAQDVLSVAVEKGGVANGTVGIDPNGDALLNDTDPEGLPLTVTAIRTGSEASGTGTPGTVDGSSELRGAYGWLKIAANGDYSYRVDNDLAAVQALRTAAQTLLDHFTYTNRDGGSPPLSDTGQITIVIRGANDNPVGIDDTATAVEAGGLNNASAGSNPSGNVLTNDTDVDSVANGETRAVAAIRTGAETATGAAGTLGVALAGSYGSLTLNADGSYQYVVDNANAAVQALRTNSDTLTELFTYTVRDAAGATDLAQLGITIRGANDAPLASDDAATAVEAGGINNATPGSNGSGNVLGNDSDVDAVVNGETRAVAGFTNSASVAGTPGSALAGSYGSLTLNADGSYTYVVDNANAAVQGLRGNADTLGDTFTYTMLDTAGATSTATLTITIRGANDNPLASDDAGTAFEAGGVANGTPGSDATGDVLFNDTDVDNVAFGETKAVSAIRTGSETGSGTAGSVGSALAGTYGALTLNADGSYRYIVDNSHAAVQALRTPADTLSETFTYTLRDAAGATDVAQLTITIRGANDNPVAANDTGTAVEAGGVANATPGADATGNVLPNDSDADAAAFGETLAVSAFAVGGGTAVTAGSTLAGAYGTLTLNADGSYTYVIDDANAAVEALRTPTDTLSEMFTYTAIDAARATATATLTITIQGANDNPVGVDDVGTALEAGGVANGTPGSDATGDVLFNDTDVDNVAFGETKAVSAIRTGSETGSGTAGSVGSALAGTYGTLTLNADGTYRYAVDNSHTAVQALRTAGDTLSETFTYTLRDAAGATDAAQLTITIRGANDNPVAVDDSAVGWPAVFGSPGSGRNPTGNVLPNDSDIDAGDVKSVFGIRSGTEAAGGSLTAVAPGTSSGSGQRVNGTWGWLNIGADGSYLYEVDFARTASLAPTAVVQDHFTYELRDTGGLTDLAQITISIRGQNNPPIALPNLPLAVEAGGIANGSPGIDPAGDVTANDFDFEGDALSVVAIRTGPETGSGNAGSIGNELAGAYGWLTQRADGSFIYRVDNANPLVQALRSSGDTRQDFFTYTVADIHGAADQATIAVTIRGANDNPVAASDAGTAVEAGGVANATAGTDANGNVLTNDSDVDAVAFGETRAVAAFAIGGGTAVAAGSTLAGAYGALTLNADGGYTYVIDNANPAVEALRTPADTLREIFTYTVVDTAGATATAALTVTIQGANDNPIAADDVALATDAGAAPVSSGNVLPNDTDIDAGDTRTVGAIRAGAEAGSGTAGQVGTALAGRYGTLLLNADGSWTYTIDTANQDVLNAAGAGRILSDVFTYTLRDAAGGTDEAQLTVTLDMVALYQDPGVGPHFGDDAHTELHRTALPGVEPAIFVERIVDAIQRQLIVSNIRSDGTDIRPNVQRQAQTASFDDDGSDLRRRLMPEVEARSLGRSLGRVGGQFVGQTVLDLATEARVDDMTVRQRHGVTSLAADGQLADPSWLPADPRQLTANPEAPAVAAPAPGRVGAAPSFREQLQLAAQRLKPAGVNFAPPDAATGIRRIS